MLVCGLKKEKGNQYTLNPGKAVLTMGSTSELSCKYAIISTVNLVGVEFF